MHNMKKGSFQTFLAIASFCLLISSCKDSYLYDNEEPSWLGASIYDELVDRGDYTYFTRLIQDCNYKEVLQKTGSKTLFVSRDSVFEAFFATPNKWGVSRYEDLTESQKNQMLMFGMINNASLIETLSSAVGPKPGQVLRLGTALSQIDMLNMDRGDSLPSNKLFTAYKQKGMYLLRDNTAPMLVLFSAPYMKNRGVSNHDFEFIMNGIQRDTSDAHIFGNKVVERDITCKNGYIHVLNQLLIPQDNMADYIRFNPDMKQFTAIMDQFCAPFPSVSQTVNYKTLHPEFNDTIFEKRYYNTHPGHALTKTPSDITVPSNELLLYDPGWNAYRTTSSAAEYDMAAMFVPSDAALSDYFNNGSGQFLKERYGSWANVPNSITSLFINAHQKYSMIESLPSRFDGMKNESGYEMKVTEDDIDKVFIASNGLVFQTKKVYPPVDYASVIAPILVSNETKVWNWAVKNCNFNLYLNSMESKYSFLIPTDRYLNDYLCPVYQGHTVKESWRFWYNGTQVVASRFNALTGDSLKLPVVSDQAIIKDRLEDMLDYHIVVGDIESGKEYYITKGGGTIRVKGMGVGMQLWGGGNMEMNAKAGYDVVAADGPFTAKVTQIYAMNNGNSYLIDRELQNPMTSLYKTLGRTEFSAFFNLLKGADNFFVVDRNYPGLDFNVSFFSAYHYTVYVPTNDAVNAALAANVIPTWETVAAEGDAIKKDSMTTRLLNFLKYHFQDNSVYIGDSITNNKRYETAASYLVSSDTLNNEVITKYKFRTLRVDNTGSDIVVKDEVSLLDPVQHPAARVVSTGGNPFNLMCRDYGFSVTTAGDVSTSTLIDYSSRIVVHQIDRVLRFRDE